MKQPARPSETTAALLFGITLTGIVQIAVCATPRAKQPDLSIQDNSKQQSSPRQGALQGGKANVEELIKQVQAKNPAATILAKQIGRSANEQLIQQTRAGDGEVREIALLCLNETGGEDAALAFADRLNDTDSQARAAAVRGLHKYPDPATYPAVLAAFDRSNFTYVRQQIPLIIGRMAHGTHIKDLRERLLNEHNADAREGLVVALAKLGDAEQQHAFILSLHASKDQVRARYIGYCEYIHAGWLLKPLEPLLDDKSAMLRVGVDARPDLIDSLRTCDLVVKLVAEISNHRFTFATDHGQNYSESQLAEVRHFLNSTPDKL